MTLRDQIACVLPTTVSLGACSSDEDRIGGATPTPADTESSESVASTQAVVTASPLRSSHQLFGRKLPFSTQTPEQRSAMKRLRRRFLRDYRLELSRWNAGERDVVFPAGRVRMRLRHNVLTEPVPLDLLVAA